MEIERRLTQTQIDELLRALSSLAEAVQAQQQVISKLHTNPRSGHLIEMIHAAGDQASVAESAVKRADEAFNR